MADEPIDSDENPESDENGAEDDAPIESQLAETEPSTSEASGLVVEAQVVAPNVRKPVPRWIFATVFAVLVLGGGLYAYDSSVRAEEATSFTNANEQDSVAGCDQYLAWSEEQGFWANLRTPLERHVAYARERREVRRAYAAAEAEDWATLCEMQDALGEAEPGRVAALRALRAHVSNRALRMQTELIGAGVPARLQAPVSASYAELGQNSVCGAPARVRYQVSAQPALAQQDAIRETGRTQVDIALQPVVQELSTRAGLFVFDLAEGSAEPVEPVLLQYSVNVDFVAGEVIRLSDGPFTVPAMNVEVRVHGPTAEVAATRINYTLPATFAVELFAGSSEGKSHAELSALAAQRLIVHLPARLRQVSGLSTFHVDGGVAAYSRCGGMEVIDRSMSVRSNTRTDGTDRMEFSCEDPQEPYYEGCCEEEDMNAVGRPEIGYRLMVNERSLVSLSAEGAHAPIVSIFSECGPTSQEITCAELGTARAVLDPGVYTAYVAGTGNEEAGPYELLSSIQPVGAIAQACSAVTRELQPGVAQSGSTARAEDNFAGNCGGAGVGEDTYRVQIAERSRVRCRVDGFASPVLHARSECEDFESEVACGLSEIRFIAEPGTFFVSVDGIERTSRGDYELLCDVEPVPDSVDGNLCAAAQTAEVTEGQESSLLVDLMSAPDPGTSLCAGSGGPEAVYRFELSEDAYVRASGAPLTLALLDECAPGTCTGSTAARLSAGTHYLVARGRTSTDFIRRTLRIHSTPIAPICEAAILLRAGVTGGAVGARSEPAIFGAECTSSTSLREAIFRVRALHPMRVRLRAEGFGLSIHEGCGGRSLTCAPASVGSVEARLEPGEYSVLVRGQPGRAFQLETEIERL